MNARDKATLMDRNLTLVGAHLQEIFADPTLLETIPQRGATVVFIPDDDPDLAQANIDMALESFAQGRNVYLYHIRTSSERAVQEGSVAVSATETN